MTLNQQRDDAHPAADRDPAGFARRRILQSTAMLPALFTVANGVLGFAAIHFATKDALGAATVFHLATAAWLIGAAMVCDMLDGTLARMTRRTSDFGAQLDSLCDMISFGVAPAVLMLQTVTMALRQDLMGVLGGLPMLERSAWIIAAVYVACGALRLARFNVETEPDESAHLNFRGLPIPGAAAAVVALVLLFGHLCGPEGGLLPREWMRPWMRTTVGAVLPVVTLAAALLMVSRFTYPHVVNQYIRGKRTFGYLVKFVVIALIMYVEFYVAMAACVTLFVLSGPAHWVRQRIRGKITPDEQQPVE